MVLTTSPRNVRTLGLMRARASHRTMASSSTPQARPKALVQVVLIESPSLGPRRSASSLGFRLVVDRGQVQNLHLAVAVGRDHDRAVSHLLVEQGASDRR